MVKSELLPEAIGDWPAVLVMVSLGVCAVIDIEAVEVSTIPSAEIVAVLLRVSVGEEVLDATSTITLANVTDWSTGAL